MIKTYGKTKEILNLTKQLWENYHTLGEPVIFKQLIHKDKKYSFNETELKNIALSDLTSTMNKLKEIAPDVLEDLLQLDFTQGYNQIMKNFPTCFELINDYKYKKKHIRVSCNFKEFKIKAECYTFIMHIKTNYPNKREWDFLSVIDELTETNLVSHDYFKIGDLFRNAEEKQLKSFIFESTGRNTFRCLVRKWF